MKQPRTRWAVCRSHTLDSTASSLSSFHSVSSPPSFNAHAPLPFSTQTMPVTSRSLFLFPLLLILIVTTICDATHHKRAVPFTSNSLHKRNLGGEFKDWYLQKFTKNYMCLDSRRVVPVDPETGHMLLKGLRKRDFLDDLLGHSKKSEKGGCRNRKCFFIPSWTMSIVLLR